MGLELNIAIDQKAPRDWDKNLMKAPYASIHQTTYYARHCERLGRKVYFVSLKQNGEVVAQNLVHVQYASSYISTDLFALRPFPIKIPPKWLSWEYGPIFWGVSDQYAYLFVKMILKAFKILPVLRALPHPLASDQPEAFRKLGFEALPERTFLLDLGKDIKQLWKSIKRKTRGNIRRAIRRGVSVEIVNSVSDFNEYFSLLNQSRKRHKMRPVNYSILYDTWRDMASHNVMKLFVAKHNGRITAGCEIPYFHGYMNYWAVAQSMADRYNKLCSTDLLMWKIIEWGHYNNQRYYDFTLGATEGSGVAFFKGKWGGRPIRLHDYTNLSKKGDLLNFLWRLRGMIL